eukprot:1345684-Amphidinium_carterae.1
MIQTTRANLTLFLDRKYICETGSLDDNGEATSHLMTFTRKQGMQWVSLTQFEFTSGVAQDRCVRNKRALFRNSGVVFYMQYAEHFPEFCGTFPEN